jgi:tRNA threonylcarbamoyl adenosine modification protein YeaZ
LSPGPGYFPAAMRLLAIDTALEACSVGIVDGGKPPLTVSEVIGRGHAERLFGMIETAMDDAALAFGDLDRVVVTIGPGSFTGLRVGIAVARGIALVIERPVIGIGTLDCHAETARSMAGARPVLAVLDAGRGELYGALFEADGLPAAAPVAAPAAAFAAAARADALIAGSGADAVAREIGGLAEARIVHRLSAPDMGALCRLGANAPATGARPAPLYLRPPDAKPQAGARIARR